MELKKGKKQKGGRKCTPPAQRRVKVQMKNLIFLISRIESASEDLKVTKMECGFFHFFFFFNFDIASLSFQINKALVTFLAL